MPTTITTTSTTTSSSSSISSSSTTTTTYTTTTDTTTTTTSTTTTYTTTTTTYTTTITTTTTTTTTICEFVINRAQDTKERLQAEAEMKAVLGSDVVGDMASSAKCAVPNELPAVTKPSIKPYYWWYYWKQGCEPCPPNAKYLHRFNGNACFVIFAYWQQVRVAKCR